MVESYDIYYDCIFFVIQEGKQFFQVDLVFFELFFELIRGIIFFFIMRMYEVGV